MLNKEKATTLFNQNACLVNNEDVVPENTAVEITSADAVGFAKQSPGVTHNSCGIGDYEMKYLTKKGFFLAITYQNVDEHRQNQAIIRSRIRLPYGRRCIEIVSVRDATDKEKESQEVAASQDSDNLKIFLQGDYNTRLERTQ